MLESAANVYLKNFHNAWKRVQWNLLTFDESRCFTSVQMKKKKKMIDTLFLVYSTISGGKNCTAYIKFLI